VVLVHVRGDAATATLLDARLARAARSLPSASVSNLLSGNGVLYGTVATPFDLARAASLTASLRSALAREQVPKALVSGAPAVESDLAGVLGADLQRGELIGAIGAMVFLFCALGPSLSVLLPFAIALCSVSGTLCLIFLIAHRVLMVLYVPNLVELVGLGLAIDYSLLMLHRFRQELAQGRPVAEAVVTTTTTAGRTVALSGTAVAMGLAVLVVVPVPFVRSLGVAGLIVAVASVVSALTVMPPFLSLLGHRGGALRPLLPFGRHAFVLPLSADPCAPHGPVVDAGTATSRTAPAAATPADGWWGTLARIVTRHPVPVAAVAFCALAAASYPVAWLQLTPGSLSALPMSMPSAQGLTLLGRRVGPGILTPVEIVIDAGHTGSATSPAMNAAIMRLAGELLAQDDVFVVAIGNRGQYVDPTNRYRLTVVILRDEFGSGPALAFARGVDHLIAAADLPPGSHAWAGGAPVQGEQFLAATYGAFGWVVAAVAVLAYLLLARALRSLLLPLIAVALGGASLLASYGLLVVLFRWGLGAYLFGLYKVDRLEGWVPLLLFVCLFGLSMDYQVFFVTRMREAFDAGASGREAIAVGLARTGRVVSAAALIMVATLTGLATGRVAGLQELGCGLAVGVLVDATLVRGLLMPSLMALCGPWTWWLPGLAARVLRVPSGSLAMDSAIGTS
jgi:RND superfamily putative drug exporter